MLLEVTVAPTAEVVSLQEVKDHLRIDTSDDDAVLRAYIVAAREYCEAAINRTLPVATYKLSLQTFDADYRRIRLLKPPLVSVASVQFIGSDNQLQTLDASNYSVDKDEPGFIRLADGCSWPELGTSGYYRVFVTYSAGYSPSACPGAVKHAIKLLVGHYYESREATGEKTVEIPFAVASLLSTQRWTL